MGECYDQLLGIVENVLKGQSESSRGEIADDSIRRRRKSAQSLNGLANECYKEGDSDGALKICKLYLEMTVRLFPGHHEDVAKSYFILGSAYAGYFDFNRAIKHLKLALEMRKRLCPGDHQDVSQSYNNLGFAYSGMQDYDKAFEYSMLALEMRKRGILSFISIQKYQFKNI